jgi:glycosyltransferase involved in cell wall biosynthesis
MILRIGIDVQATAEGNRSGLHNHLQGLVRALRNEANPLSLFAVDERGNGSGLGSVSFGKGVDRAIEGIATIPSESRPPLLWIGNYSDSAYMDRIKNLAMESGVQLECKLMVTDDELADLLSRASCMIYTSRLEPFGFAPLEANACGTAVVAIAEGGIRETVVSGVNGELIRSFDPKAIGNIVQSYTENHDKARRVGLAAREHVLANWSWEASVEELERELLATTRRRKKA